MRDDFVDKKLAGPVFFGVFIFIWAFLRISFLILVGKDIVQLFLTVFLLLEMFSDVS